MAKAGLTIAISGTYNGRAIERARQDLQRMRISAVSELGGVGSSLVDFGSKAAEVGGEIHNMGYKMEQVGSKATKGITLPIAAAALACGKAAVDIDTALTGVRKTLDASEAEYNQLKEAAIEFSKTNAVSAAQILDIQALGAQLGFTKTELQEFGEVVSGLDIATDMDAETAGTEMAQFANITRMAHGEISNYGSAIVGLGNNMATTESDISHMAMRLAAAGTQVGMSQADILGLAAALSSMGVEAEAGGTAISTIMSQIDKDIATGSDAVETWAATAGMSAQDFADAWRKDPVQALSALLSNMEKTTAEGGNMSVMLEELGIDSVRQTDIMKRLAGNSQLVTKAVALSNDEWKKNTALSNEVNNRNASMAAKIEILKNKVVAVAEKVGTPLVNALLDVVDAAEPLIEGVGKAAQAFADMDEKDQKMILGLVGAAAAFGPVMTVAGKLTQGIGNLVVGVGKGAQTFGLLKNELGTVKEAFALVRGGAGTAAEGMALVEGSTTLVSGALGVLKTAMVGLGIGAAVVAIGAVVAALAKVVQHEQMVYDATGRLEHAMDGASAAYSGYASGSAVALKSLKDIKAGTDDVISSQGKLAKSMSDQWSDYGTKAAEVDAYAHEIRKLTERYDEQGNRIQLTADEQQRLKMAVDGFNAATGASIAITDELNGTLDTSTDAIMRNADAFKQQAAAQAAQEQYKDLYKQQIENQQQLAEVTAKLTEAKKAEEEEWRKSGDEINSCSAEVRSLEKQQRDLTATIASNNRAQDQLIATMQGTTASFASLDEALSSSGVAMSDFGNLTDAQLAALREGFDGSLTSIIVTCQEQGIQIPLSLANAITGNMDAVHGAARNAGDAVALGFVEGLEGGAGIVQDASRVAANSMVKTVESALGINSPSRVMMEIGRNVDLGLQQGIDGSKGLPVQSLTAIAGLLRGSVEGLPAWMQGLGGAAGSALSGGLSSMQGAVSWAASALGSSAQLGISPVQSVLGGVGTSAAGAFAGAVGSFNAYWHGASLGNSALSGASSVQSWIAGNNFSVGFVNGMYGVNVWQAAYSIGRSALGAIYAALGIASPSKEARKVGNWFGEGAVLGMRDTEQDIATEAMRMSEAMSLNPTIGASNGAGGYANSYQQAGGRRIEFNVTINVTAKDEKQAVGIGSSIGEQLYLEFARRERNEA